VIGPLIALDLVHEGRVVIISAADVDDEIAVGMLFLEVPGDVLNVVAVGLLEQIGGGEGHGDDSVGDVGEIQVLAVVAGGYFGTSHHLSHKTEHQLI